MRGVMATEMRMGLHGIYGRGWGARQDGGFDCMMTCINNGSLELGLQGDNGSYRGNFFRLTGQTRAYRVAATPSSKSTMAQREDVHVLVRIYTHILSRYQNGGS